MVVAIWTNLPNKYEIICNQAAITDIAVQRQLFFKLLLIIFKSVTYINTESKPVYPNLKKQEMYWMIEFEV